MKTIKKNQDVEETVKKPSKDLLSRPKMAGGYIPPALADKFSLYAVYQGLSRSLVIGDLIEKALMDAPSNEEMIDKISKRILLLKMDDVTIDDYRNSVIAQLNKKKLSQDQIKAIISRMGDILNGSKKEKKTHSK